MTGYGRPPKGKTRRVPITVYAAMGMIEEIDRYMEERNAQQEAAYSRSDFYNEDEKPNRNKSVTKKSEERNTRDNTNNTDNEKQEK